MPVSLSSLRVEAELEASKYVQGAQQKAAADERMVQSGEKVAQSVDQPQRRLGESPTAVERLARSIDPAYNAQYGDPSGWICPYCGHCPEPVARSQLGGKPTFAATHLGDGVA